MAMEKLPAHAHVVLKKVWYRPSRDPEILSTPMLAEFELMPAPLFVRSDWKLE